MLCWLGQRLRSVQKTARGVLGVQLSLSLPQPHTLALFQGVEVESIAICALCDLDQKTLDQEAQVLLEMGRQEARTTTKSYIRYSRPDLSGLGKKLRFDEDQRVSTCLLI